MKITDQEIIASARRLRQADDSQLSVRPWQRHRLHIPQWLVAIPAAALVGFILGFAVRQPSTDPAQTALAKADTVFVHEVVTQHDTVSIPAVAASSAQPRRKQSRPAVAHPQHTGLSVADDHINYSLLVMQ